MTTLGAALLASYLIGMEHRALLIFWLLTEGNSTLIRLYFSPSLSADRKEYNEIKQSKLEYEGFGLDIRRNFQKEGG